MSSFDYHQPFLHNPFAQNPAIGNSLNPDHHPRRINPLRVVKPEFYQGFCRAPVFNHDRQEHQETESFFGSGSRTNHELGCSPPLAPVGQDNFDCQQELPKVENFSGYRGFPTMNSKFVKSSLHTPMASSRYRKFDCHQEVQKDETFSSDNGGFSTMNPEFVGSSLPTAMASAGYGNFGCQQEVPKDETFSCDNRGFSAMNSSEFVPSSLPPGYRFCPTNKELMVHYLYKKVRKEPLPSNEIPEINLYNYDPEDFKSKFCQNGEDKWYFFTQRISASDTDKRAKRRTPNGFWKVSTKGPIPGTAGRNNTLVFHSGKQGKKTNWIMHEYMLDRPIEGQKLENWVLCCIYKKKEKDAKAKQDQETPVASCNHGNQEADDVHALHEHVAHETGNRMDDPGLQNPSMENSDFQVLSRDGTPSLSDLLMELFDAPAPSDHPLLSETDYSLPSPLVYCNSPFNPLLSD